MNNGNSSAYVFGGLADRDIIIPFAKLLERRAVGEAFIDWIGPGEEADSKLREYCKERGLDYKQTLETYAAKLPFFFDKFHINRTDVGISCKRLGKPPGKSANLEIGFALGSGKRVYMYAQDGSDSDGLYDGLDGIFYDTEDLVEELRNNIGKPTEREGFNNLFQIYHTLRESGLEKDKSRQLTLERIGRTYQKPGEGALSSNPDMVYDYLLAEEFLLGQECKALDVSALDFSPAILRVSEDKPKMQTLKEHLDFGFALGSGRRGYIVFDGEPERCDIMYQFADGLFFSEDELQAELDLFKDVPTCRRELHHIFGLYGSSRSSGKDIRESKGFVDYKLSSTWGSFSGGEKEAFRSKYHHAQELLKT